ncbi:hypothetical protein V5O48_015290 [Marasmius crinis-equi]|uniref:F-box domain-containing protein n=1 Tax=Marasmius crinis-equi TaxID=585013 RepID=A0ABR3EUW9_9AGAR
MSSRTRRRKSARLIEQNNKGSASYANEDQGSVGITGLPLDIVYEIFANLQTPDILNLSRTTQRLRDFILFRPSSSSVWRIARENVVPKIPSPPEELGLSEPQYASLLFDTECRMCGMGPSDGVLWMLRLRCHDKCARRRLSTLDAIVKRQSDVTGHLTTKFMLDHCGHVPCYTYRSTNLYVPNSIRRLRAEWLKVKDDLEKLMDWEGRKRQEHRQLEKWATECKSWTIDLTHQRRMKITSELLKLGWKQEELEDPLFSDPTHGLRHQAKLFTAHDWHANIKAPLIKRLEEVRAQRLEAERKRVFNKRSRTFATLYLDRCDSVRSRGITLPSKGDFIVSPIAARLANLLYSTDIKRHVKKRIRRILDNIPDSALEITSKAWLAEKEADVKSKLLVESDEESLDTTLFLCRSCNQHFPGPRIFDHLCTSTSSPSSSAPGIAEYEPPAPVLPPDWKWPQYNPLKISRAWYPWNPETFIFDEHATGYFKQLMTLCDVKDCNELEAMDPQLKCQDCRSNRGAHVAQYNYLFTEGDSQE